MLSKPQCYAQKCLVQMTWKAACWTAHNLARLLVLIDSKSKLEVVWQIVPFPFIYYFAFPTSTSIPLSFLFRANAMASQVLCHGCQCARAKNRLCNKDEKVVYIAASPPMVTHSEVHTYTHTFTQEYRIETWSTAEKLHVTWWKGIGAKV